MYVLPFHPPLFVTWRVKGALPLSYIPTPALMFSTVTCPLRSFAHGVSAGHRVPC